MSGMYEAVMGAPEVVTYVLKNPYQKIKRRLFCMYCGGFLQVTYKEIAMVIEGSPADPEAITAEIKCSKCKAIIEIC